jgi:uncharacterized DUF497 family protein
MTVIYFPMDRFPEELTGCTGFEWDEGNVEKSWERHGVLATECEEVFFQRPIRIAPDSAHSHDEERSAALGVTAAGRRLAVVFTIRGTLIRVISARDMNRRERRTYEERKK